MLYTHRGVTLLGLASLTGEDNELGFVCVEALDVELLALLAQIPPPVVNGNADAASLLPADASLLQLSQSKSTTLTELPVVSHGLTTNSGAEGLEGANT